MTAPTAPPTFAKLESAKNVADAVYRGMEKYFGIQAPAVPPRKNRVQPPAAKETKRVKAAPDDDDQIGRLLAKIDDDDGSSQNSDAAELNRQMRGDVLSQVVAMEAKEAEVAMNFSQFSELE